MKNIFLSVFCWLLIFSISTVFADDNNFRNTKWGMSKDQVKASEKTMKLEHEADTILGYTDTVAGMSSLVIYYFIKNQLTHARYGINEKHSNKSDYIVDFNKLKDLLIQKYGVPKSTDIRWYNDLYKNDPQHHGTAVSLGHLAYYTDWETDDTEIILLLWGDNYKINLTIQYEGLKYKDLRKQETKKQNMDKL